MNILIVDGNNLGWTAAYTVGHLVHNESPTGVMYGFMNQLISIAHFLRPNIIVFAWDARKNFRRELFPDYKKKRTELDPEEQAFKEMVIVQLNRLRTKVLPSIGFRNNFQIEGYEADDIIASLVYTYSHHELHIVSSDNDLYQLLINDNVSLHSPKDVEHSIVRKKFEEVYGIPPERWAEVKMIAGCSTDEVPGVYRVGEKTALKFLKGELNPNTKTYQRIVSEESRKIIEFNEKLVKLPAAQLDISIKRDKIRQMNFVRVCKQYGFKSLVRGKKLKQAREAFRLRGLGE